MLRCHPVKFGAYRLCGGGDIKFFTRSKDQYDMTIENMSSQSVIVSNLVLVGSVEVDKEHL